MSSIPEHPTTSVLLIDGNANDRAFYAEGLRRCTCDYEIIEATDRLSGRALYQSRQIDCAVLELASPDDSGFQILVDLVPRLSRPHVPVIILTQFTHRGAWEAAKQNGAMSAWQKHSRPVRIWITPFSVRWRLWDRRPRKIVAGPS